MNGCSYEVDSYEGAWNSGKEYDDGNKGHRPGVKGGYFPVPPTDSQQDIRTAMSLACEEMGLKFEVHPPRSRDRGPGRDQRGRQYADQEGRRGADPQIRAARTWLTVMEDRRSRSCRNPSWATTAQGCTCISPCKRTASRYFPATNTADFPTPRFTTSAASSSMLEPSTRSPTRAPTAISGWCRGSKRP